jgi:hypothetical protein
VIGKVDSGWEGEDLESKHRPLGHQGIRHEEGSSATLRGKGQLARRAGATVRRGVVRCSRSADETLVDLLHLAMSFEHPRTTQNHILGDFASLGASMESGEPIGNLSNGISVPWERIKTHGGGRRSRWRDAKNGQLASWQPASWGSLGGRWPSRAGLGCFPGLPAACKSAFTGLVS